MTSLSLASPGRALATTPPRIVLAALLVALGDFLFLDGALGISIPLFLAGLAAASLATSPSGTPPRALAGLLAFLALALLPLVEAVGWPQVLLAVVAVAIFAVAVSGAWERGTAAAISSARRLLLRGPFQIVGDLWDARHAAARPGGIPVTMRAVAGWVVPLGLCAVFAGLFAAANPLIEGWLGAADPSSLLDRLQPARIVFWGVILALSWPFVAVRLRDRRKDELPVTGSLGPMIPGSEALPSARPLFDGSILGRDAILRSLVLFNLLFAVQTALDALFLWGGVRLPEGMTYAAYAHRGAHPLIATALLAAGFVLVAMRPGGPGEGSPAIRALVYVFVAQNVGLVASSLLRLDLYVEVYSLTMMRAAAGIWMGLVAVGLVLIVARIALERSNRWLVGANLLALALTLYACAFVNFPSEIARFNDRHSSDRIPGGRPLDAWYLAELGPQAVPVLDRYLDRRGADAPACLVAKRARLAREHSEAMRDWRAWTYRDWRLERYLERRRGAIALRQ